MYARVFVRCASAVGPRGSPRVCPTVRPSVGPVVSPQLVFLNCFSCVFTGFRINPESPHVGSSVCPRVGPRGVPAALVRRCGGPLGNTSQGTPAHGLPTEGAALPHSKLVACGGLAEWVLVRQRGLAWAGRNKIKIQNLSWALGSLSGVSGTGAVRVLPAKIWAGHSDHFRVCRGLERRGRCPRGPSEARAPTLQ